MNLNKDEKRMCINKLIYWISIFLIDIKNAQKKEDEYNWWIEDKITLLFFDEALRLLYNIIKFYVKVYIYY